MTRSLDWRRGRSHLERRAHFESRTKKRELNITKQITAQYQALKPIIYLKSKREILYNKINPSGNDMDFST